jgi:hypothetical protein
MSEELTVVRHQIEIKVPKRDVVHPQERLRIVRIEVDGYGPDVDDDYWSLTVRALGWPLTLKGEVKKNSNRLEIAFSTRSQLVDLGVAAAEKAIELWGLPKDVDGGPDDIRRIWGKTAADYQL